MAVVQFNLRVPEELKKQVDEAAQISGRSINAEAAYRLEQSFVENDRQKGVIDDGFFDELGLTRDEFVAFVKMSLNKAIDNAVSEIKTKEDE